MQSQISGKLLDPNAPGPREVCKQRSPELSFRRSVQAQKWIEPAPDPFRYASLMTDQRVSGSKVLFDGVPGPTPWYARPGSPAIEGFRWEQTSERWPKGDKTLLVGAAGVVAVLDFYSYVMRLDSSTLLIWNQRNGTKSEGSQPVHLVVIRPSLLPPFGDGLAREIQQMEAVGARLAILDKPVASMSLNTGIIGEDVPSIFPKELEAIEELLILCNSSAIGIQDATKANLALLVARPRQSTFRLYPQDWFNSADLDRGYQWVTRVTRNPETGRVHGEGFRIDPFELDDTLCRLVTEKSANESGP